MKKLHVIRKYSQTRKENIDPAICVLRVSRLFLKRQEVEGDTERNRGGPRIREGKASLEGRERMSYKTFIYAIKALRQNWTIFGKYPQVLLLKITNFW